MCYLAPHPGLQFALALVKPLPCPEICPSTSVAPHLGLEFALALAKPLVWPEICPSTSVASPPGLEFALALAKPLVWPEICPSTGETLKFALALGFSQSIAWSFSPTFTPSGVVNVYLILPTEVYQDEKHHLCLWHLWRLCKTLCFAGCR